MKPESFIKKTIAYTAAALLISALAVIIIDPCMHYHAPIGSLEAAETDERLSTLGSAQHEYYETALIGSSMSENFKESWFEDGVFGDSCVKLCMAGSFFTNYDPLLKAVCSHPEVKNVCFCMDNYLLISDPTDTELHNTTIPEYLSNDDLIDDAYYIWNKSILFDHIPKFLTGNITGRTDDAYTWQDIYVFTKDGAKTVYGAQRLAEIEPESGAGTFFPNVDALMAALAPYIESRPDITFYFYTPPYSILYWDDCIRRGQLAAQINAMGYAYEKLLSYDNVRVFFFMDDYELITDLEHYRDYSHYDQSVNHYMYECMRDGKRELRSEDIFDTLTALQSYAAEYDYEAIFR